MSSFVSKVLWTVNMPTAAAEDQLRKHALLAGCTGVAIRTSNALLPASIDRFHKAGLKVFGWRWPACKETRSPPNYYALDQARYVAQTLIPAGLDGYFADIESDNDGGLNDWDSGEFAPLAEDFCSIIQSNAPTNFVFSITAGCAQPTGNPSIPWATFSPFCSFVMPQTYWRWGNPKTGAPQDINGGTPKSAYMKAVMSWRTAFPTMRLQPILGELALVTSDEILSFGAIMTEESVMELHAYTDGNEVPLQNLEAIASL